MSLRKKIIIACILFTVLAAGVVISSTSLGKKLKLLADSYTAQNQVATVDVQIFFLNPNGEAVYVPNVRIDMTDYPGSYKITGSSGEARFVETPYGAHTLKFSGGWLCPIPDKTINVVSSYLFVTVNPDPNCTPNPVNKVDLQFIVRDSSIATSSLAGIRVEAKNIPGGPVFASFITTDQGTYFNQLDPGMYYFDVNRSGTVNYNPNYSSLTDDGHNAQDRYPNICSTYQGCDVYSAYLDRTTPPTNTFSLRGKVTKSGTADLIGDATVRATKANDANISYEVQTTSSLNLNQANYELTLPAGSWDTTVSKSGFDSSGPRGVTGDTNDVKIENFPLDVTTTKVRIRGKVVNENNEPLVGATVGLYPYQNAVILAQAKSKKEGKYEITVDKLSLISGGYYQLVATYPLTPVSAFGYYYNPQKLPFFIYQQDAMENMDIILNISSLAGTGIYGQITGVKDDNQFPLYPVKITAKSENDNELKDTIDLQNGFYLLLGLQGDKDYVVRADYWSIDLANQYTSVVRIVHVGKNARVKVDFRMDFNPNFIFPGHIEGKVVDSTGAPIQSAQIFIYDETARFFVDVGRDQYHVGGAITNQNGRYFVNLPPNDEGQIKPRKGSLFDLKRYTIYVRHRDYNPKNVDNPVMGDSAGPQAHFNTKKSIEIHRHQGDVIRVDFVIDGNKDPNPDVDKVKIVVKQIYVDWQGHQVSSWRDANGKRHTSPEPAADAKVNLTVEGNYTGRVNSGSQTSVLKTTDARGVAKFDYIPKEVMSILVTKEGYFSIDGQALEFNPGRMTDRDKEGYLTFEYTLKSVISPDLVRLITDPGFRNDVFQNQCWWTNRDAGLDNTICGAGCCLTSISMGLRFYLGQTDSRGREITPNLVSSVGGSLLSYDMVSRAVNGISDSNLTVEEVGGREGIINAVKKGYPVVAHFSQGKVPGHTGASGHCILIIGAVGNQYVYLDPNPHSGYGSLETAGFGGPDIGSFAIKPASGSAIFRMVTGGGQNQSQAASTAVAVNAADYNINKKVEALSVTPVAKVIYEVNFADGRRDEIQATPSGIDYNATVPAFLIHTGNDFTYKTFVVSPLGTKIDLGRDSVTIDNSPITLAKKIDRLRSTLLFRLSRMTTIQNLRKHLTYAYYNQRIRQLLGIEGLPHASLSGRVYDLNGNPVGQGIFVKVGDFITETNSDGTYSINDALVGTQLVAVYGVDRNKELYLAGGSKRTSARIRQNQNNTLEIRLNEILNPDSNAANGFVGGIVYSSTNNPLPFVRVRLQGGQTVNTSADGYFLVRRAMDTPRGQFNLELPDYPGNVKQVQVYKGDLSPVDLSSGVITGNFTGEVWFNWVRSYHPSELAKNVEVVFFDFGYVTTTDDQGKFYLRNFAPGSYWFVVRDPETHRVYPNRTFPFNGAQVTAGTDYSYPFAVQKD